MTATTVRQNHLRPDRSDLRGLAMALSLSVALHMAVFGAYKLEQRFGWLAKIHPPAWLVKMQQALAQIRPAKKSPQPAEREVPLMFVEVNPAANATEAPKNAKYYSNKSSRAANPDADADATAPKIAGTQELITKTEATPRSRATPLQPAPSPAQPNRQAEAQAQPKRTQPGGDLAFAKPEKKLQKEDGKQETVQPKPRTLAEAQARQAANSLAGEKMKQAGGVKRHAMESSLDVAATPFGEYDAAIIAAIQNRWFSLLDSRNFTRERTGKVVLQFHMNYEGKISAMFVEQNTVGELLGLLCQKAVLDPSPYAPWPGDMRRMVGGNFREVRFTFYYN